MATSNDSMTEGLAQIAKEEAQFSFGVNRYFMAIVAIGLISSGIYLAILEASSDIDQIQYWTRGPFLVCLGLLFAVGTYRANNIHKKLKSLNSSERKKKS